MSTVGPESVPGVGELWITCTLAVCAITEMVIMTAKKKRKIRFIIGNKVWFKNGQNIFAISFQHQYQSYV